MADRLSCTPEYARRYPHLAPLRELIRRGSPEREIRALAVSLMVHDISRAK